MAQEDRLTTYVRGILERDGISADSLTPRVTSRTRGESSGGTGILPEHLESLRKVERGDALNEQDRVRIEAIVLPNGLRPAFDVVRDSFEDLPATWKDVTDRRSVVDSLIRGIGRLNLAGHPSLRFVGTAFVIATDVLLTNRHVAEFFVERSGPAPSLQFKSGLTGSLDFKQEVGLADTLPLAITAPIAILEDWDAALLRVDALPPGVRPLPLAGAPPSSTLEGRLTTVIGYPAMDPGSDLIQQIQIFRGVFDKKRLMPGRLMGMRPTVSFSRTVTALAHDCTTLGGNSGSAVIDIATGTVVGLHFAGEHLIANYAVPTWELAKDGAVTAAGITFG
jgi:endonuclease G